MKCPAVRSALVIISIAVLLASHAPANADAQTLCGIHWWGYGGSVPVDQTPKQLFDLPTYSMWDLETVVTNSDFWWQASWFKPLYQAIYPLNASIITRADYTWQDCVPPPSDPNYAGWPAFYVSNVVNQLHDYSHIYIVGNEPNLIVTSWPSGQITPAGYATVYRNVRNAVHNTADVGAPGQHLVLIAGPSPGGAEGIRWMDGNQYLGQVLDNLSPSEVDGFAIHAYGWGVADFRDGYRSQLQVIDQKGFGDKPVWITEFNRYTTDDNDEQYSAQFVRDAFADVNAWNQTPGAHNIVGMTWFIYDSDNQAGGGWNGYAIEYWKTHGFPYGDSRDLYTAFEQSVDLRYPAGRYGSNPNQAWSDLFNDGTIDQSAPDPNWQLTTESGAVIQESAGYLTFLGASGSASYGVARNAANPVYDNFVITTKVYLVNSSSTNGDESNADIKFRADGYGIGYSLSFKALDSPNVINLRRSDTWEVIQSKEVTYDLHSGTILYVRIECNGTRIKIKVGTTAGASNVVNSDLTDSTFLGKGGFWLTNYHMMDARFDYFNYSPIPTGGSTGIQGIVKDSLGNNLGGANVSTGAAGYSTTSNPDGTYSISGMDPGAYDVTASKTNYTSQTASAVVVGADAKTTANLTLTDATRPTTPVVTDDGAYQTSADSITFSWTSSDPESGIAEYRCAVSTSTNSADVIPGGEWLSVGTATSHTRTGISLTNGQTYYALVKSKNGVGLIGLQGNSNGIKVAKGVGSIALAKAEPDNLMVALDDRIVTAKFSDFIYVEDPDRTSGMRVSTTGIDEGTVVDFAGFLSTSSGERRISGYAITPGITGQYRDPIAMGNRQLGGELLNARTPGVTDGIGVNNIGLLVTTWGKVVEIEPGENPAWFKIDDGSGIVLKVSVPSTVTINPTWQYVFVTGISSVEVNGGIVSRLLRVRTQSDIWGNG